MQPMILQQIMAAANQGSGGGATDPDPYFSDVSLLLHMDGTNGSTTFTDSSNNSHSVTSNGGAQISTTQSKFGGASGYFDGTDDYLLIDDSDFAQGTADRTWEAWIYPTDISDAHTILATYFPTVGNGELIQLNSSGNFIYGSHSGSVGITSITTSTSITTGQWYHVAMTRESGTVKLWLDGELVGSDTTTLSTSNTDFKVGADEHTSKGIRNFFEGYIDEVRITNGVARYTSNFTPPTQAFPNA